MKLVRNIINLYGYIMEAQGLFALAAAIAVVVVLLVQVSVMVLYLAIECITQPELWHTDVYYVRMIGLIDDAYHEAV